MVVKLTLQAIMAEGKQHALAVGVTTMSTAEIRSVNKGIAVETFHYLGDGTCHLLIF
jgi:PUA domain protein